MDYNEDNQQQEKLNIPSSEPPQPVVVAQQPQQLNSNVLKKPNNKKDRLKQVFWIIAFSLLIIVGIASIISGLNTADESNKNFNTQKNDTLRGLDLVLLSSEINNFMANNNGKIPTFEEASRQVIPDYVLYKEKRKEFNDPLTNKQYVIVSYDPQIGEIQYAQKSKCSGNSIVSGGPRQTAVRTLLESGEYYCVSSQ